MKSTPLIFLLPLMTLACTTPYQKLGKRGGYSEQRISENVYLVSFQGNTRTKDEVVYKNFLRRCAELTLEKGYQYFNILKTEDKTKNLLVIQQGTPQSNRPVTTVAYTNDMPFIPIEHKNITKHLVEGQIALFKANEAPIDAFKAQEVLHSMRN
jgi:hypothetical protein